jgi:hypothetical protein
MFRRFFAAAACCALTLGAQTAESPEIRKAQAEIETLKALAEAGAVPRVRIESAERELADARDAAFLRRTLYGEDLTEEQSGEMIAAAQRRLAFQREAVAAARKLVDEGVLPRLRLTEPLERADRARKELDLAESRARLVQEIAGMARAEAQAVEAAAVEAPPTPAGPASERYDGDGFLSAREIRQMVLAFESRFSKPLPVSANGDTAVHRAMGFDHRNRLDIALHPDQAEGVWLRRYLEFRRVPFFAFRSRVPGKATAAHIHVGPPSARLVKSAPTASGGQ